MNRNEFIEWLKNKSGFIRSYNNSDNEWRELRDHAEYIWDELTVEDDKVIFNWEECEWGGTNYRSCSFDEFIELYECYGLK
jgi:hypothetical protein